MANIVRILGRVSYLDRECVGDTYHIIEQDVKFRGRRKVNRKTRSDERGNIGREEATDEKKQ